MGTMDESDTSSENQLWKPWNMRTHRSECTLTTVESSCNENSPSQSPNWSSEPTFICQDDPDFLFEDNSSKSCLWASEKPNKRCKNIEVAEACPVTCNTCWSSEPTFICQDDPDF